MTVYLGDEQSPFFDHIDPSQSDRLNISGDELAQRLINSNQVLPINLQSFDNNPEAEESEEDKQSPQKK